MERAGKTCSRSGAREAWPGLCLTCETCSTLVTYLDLACRQHNASGSLFHVPQ